MVPYGYSKTRPTSNPEGHKKAASKETHPTTAERATAPLRGPAAALRLTFGTDDSMRGLPASRAPHTHTLASHPEPGPESKGLRPSLMD